MQGFFKRRKKQPTVSLVESTIFVSHAHDDNTYCDKLMEILTSSGMDVWYDRQNLIEGSILSDEIQFQLKRRQILILLASKASLNSFWVNLEINAFLGLMAQDKKEGLNQRVLIPILIDDSIMPPFLDTFYWIDARRLSQRQVARAIESIYIYWKNKTNNRYYEEIINIDNKEILIRYPEEIININNKEILMGSLKELGFKIRYTHSQIVGLHEYERVPYPVTRTGPFTNTPFIIPPIIEIPEGSFYMGSKSSDAQTFPDELPQCEIFLPKFSIGRFPVTVQEYACAVDAGVVPPPGKGRYRDILWEDQLQNLDHPVVCVSWENAKEYIDWLNSMTYALPGRWRLPTEAEWEKAARGDDGRIYPWGNTWNESLANTAETKPSYTTAINAFPDGISPFGLFDMAGNIFEWCSSNYYPYPYSITDGREDYHSREDKCLRGGSWGSPFYCARCAFRNKNAPMLVDDLVGFRLAKS